MKRILLGLATLMYAAAMPAISQQLQQPAVPANKPLPTQTGIGPQLKQAHSTQVPSVATDPSQRAQAASPIPSAGPAVQVLGVRVVPMGRKSAEGLLDAAGKPVNGMIQIAPNRVYDTTTGLYHWTRTEGQQQKLID